MNKFMMQVRQRDQLEGREPWVRVDWAREVIAFRVHIFDKRRQAYQDIDFFIDTRPMNTGGDPIVRSPRANRHTPRGHENHMYNDHSCCLGINLRRMDLCEILRRCEAWAGGIITYEYGGHFPDFTEVFARPRRPARTSGGIFQRIFG